MNGQENTKFIAFIPVRGGSKSIPLKNIKMFCGKPLVYWTLKAASEASPIEKVYVATDDDRIKHTVSKFNLPKVVVVDRGRHTATDNATTESAMLDFAEKHDFENILLVQATSPLLEKEDLEGGIFRYIDDRADSLLSVVRQKRFIWQASGSFAQPVNYDPAIRPRRQDWEGFLVENGAFYITSRERLLQSRCRISGNTSFYEMKEESYFEIDEESDWVIAEQLKQKHSVQNGLSGVNFNRINLLISDVDGVLTDTGMYYSTSGEELKKFSARDGKGIELLKAAGIKVMFLTSEDISIVSNRAKKLNIDFLFMGIKDKKHFLEDFFEKHSEFDFSKTAYVGDDVNDLEGIRSAYFSATPSDGVEQVKRSAVYTCSSKGGHGCIREVCDLILNGRTNG